MKIAFVSAGLLLSERRACKLLGVDRASYRYEPRPDRNAELCDEFVKLARQKLRIGYRRLHAVLERRELEGELLHIQLGRPMQNRHVERFQGRLRDDCLSASWFKTLNDVRCTLATWREKLHCERSDSSLGYRTPDESRKTLEGRGAMAPLPSQITTINTEENL